MTLLRFDDVEGHARGFLSFFAVHGTSLYEVSFWLGYGEGDAGLIGSRAA